MSTDKHVCVKVDCQCPFAPDYLFYPNHLIGWHQVDLDDPRLEMGAAWDHQQACAGMLDSQACDNEECWPAGRVVDIRYDCSNCPNRTACGWLIKA